ncbi:MAG TPA: hypothetical protein VGE59_01930 [Patescibacteria group bacterium]
MSGPPRRRGAAAKAKAGVQAANRALRRRCAECDEFVTKGARFCPNCGGEEFVEPKTPEFLTTPSGKLTALVVGGILAFLIWKYLIPEVLFYIGYCWMWTKYFVVQTLVIIASYAMLAFFCLGILSAFLWVLPGGPGLVKVLWKGVFGFIGKIFTWFFGRFGIDTKEKKKKKEGDKKDEDED